MPDEAFSIRPATDGDRVPLAVLIAEVAEERDGIATEPPFDIEAHAASWREVGRLPNAGSTPAATASVRSPWQLPARGEDAGSAQR